MSHIVSSHSLWWSSDNVWMSLIAWGKKLLCSLVAQHWNKVYCIWLYPKGPPESQHSCICLELNNSWITIDSSFVCPLQELQDLKSFLLESWSFNCHKHFLQQNVCRNCCINTALSPVWQQALWFPCGSWAAWGESGRQDWVFPIFSAKINIISAVFHVSSLGFFHLQSPPSVSVVPLVSLTVSFYICVCTWSRSSSMTHKVRQVEMLRNE